jgi:hypothetical protein
MVDFADLDFGGASFGGGYSDPTATGDLRTRDDYGRWGNYWAGPMDDNPNTVVVEADALAPIGPITGLEMEGAATGGSYNANNMGGGTPGALDGPTQNPGAGRMAGNMSSGPTGPIAPGHGPQLTGSIPGPTSEGGGELLIMRLQGLTPEQQNFLLNDPQALAAFMREYDRIIQGGGGNQIGVGQMRDVDYTHGTYTVPSGLISQGTRPWLSDI